MEFGFYLIPCQNKIIIFWILKLTTKNLSSNFTTVSSSCWKEDFRKSMSMEASDAGEDHLVSIPRGGPIYVPDMVSPLIRVPDFEHSVFDELQVLNSTALFVFLESLFYFKFLHFFYF